MFVVVGERLNMTRKSIRERVWDRDEDFVRAEARQQAAAGATHLDINAGGHPDKEVADMEWLTGIVSGAVDLPLCFDSANPAALRAGLALCNRPGTLINSITNEADRRDAILPLVQEFNTGVVALLMDDSGMPCDFPGRKKVLDDLAVLLRAAGVGLDRAYFDPLVRPASTNPGEALAVLALVRALRREYPEAHVALGLSNVSYGVPARNNLNRAFLAMLVEAGCDGAIIDPTEPGMMDTLFASRAITGEDEFCMDYLGHIRG